MVNTEIMTVEQVAQMLGRSKNTIYMMVFQKRIPHYKPNRKSLYFKKAEIEAWAFLQRIPTQDEIETTAATEVLAGSKK